MVKKIAFAGIGSWPAGRIKILAMKPRTLFSALVLLALSAGAQTPRKPNAKPIAVKASTATRSTGLEGTWMYGNFSTTEYWSQSPKTYLGNAFTMAVAFVFKPDGTYEQYFTSQTTNFTGSVYHQSATKGSYTVDEVNKTLTCVALSSHYKRTDRGKVVEDRDMRPEEIAKKDQYTYAFGTESNGTKSLKLFIKGTQSTLSFLQKDF